MLFGGNGIYCYARKTNRGYENEKFSAFLNKFSRQLQSNIPEPETKKENNQSLYSIMVDAPLVGLIQLTKNSLAFSIYTLSVYCKAAWFSQSLTTVLSGLSTLDQIQLLSLSKLSSMK